MERGDTWACEDCRDAISARLDGEDLPGEAERIDAHLLTCPDCRVFAERAARVTRLTRTRAAEPVPDLTAAVLAAAPPPVRARRADALRVALGGVGVGQFALAVSGVLAGAGHHGTVELAGASAVHFSHESSAWNLALAVGFLWAATGGSRLAGLVPVVGAFVGVLAVLSVGDVLGGRVDPGRLLTHGLVVAGFLLLVALRRTTGDGGGGFGTAPIVRTGTDRSHVTRWTGRAADGDGGLAPHGPPPRGLIDVTRSAGNPAGTRGDLWAMNPATDHAARRGVLPWLGTLARLVLGGVWIAAGATKITDLDGSVRAVRAYRLLPETAAQIVGAGLPPAEILLGLLLGVGVGVRATALVSAVLMAAFVVGIASAWARGLRIDCGCFGTGGELAAGEDPAYGVDLLRDAALLAVSLALARWPVTGFGIDGALDARRARPTREDG